MMFDPNPILSAIGDHISLRNNFDHEHRLGWFMEAEVLLDGEHVATYTQPGDGSEAKIVFAEQGESRLQAFFGEINLTVAMVKSGNLKSVNVPCDLAYQLGTVFEFQYDRQFPIN